MDKKQSILTTALRLFVADGFHGTPTSKIANDAGVANGTLFYYYKTKEDLIVALYNFIKDEQARDVESITHADGFVATKFKNIFIHAVNWSLTNKEKANYIQQFNFSPHMARVSHETLQAQSLPYTQLINEGINRKLLKQQPPALITSLFNGQVYGVCQYLSTDTFEPQDKDRVINQSYEMVWDMLKYM